MKEIFYKVTLLSDVVLNSSLATEGNMSSLDYIPGSNFLGITASKLYKNISTDESLGIFHSGKVRFGDATIANEDNVSYAMPAMYYMDKLKKEIGKDNVFMDYLIDRDNPPKDDNGNKYQLKQVRSGYVFSDGKVVKEINKSFAIKSAQDRTKGTSKKSAMFGFESLNKGLEFIFSIQFEDETLIGKVNEIIEGSHRLGKSKNAEFGQINIEKLQNQPIAFKCFNTDEYVLVYAQSNLCFIDKNGMPTYQPNAEQLGLNKDAKVIWSKSQIRTFTYSPWNSTRNTSNTQRFCIARGSVFYVKSAKNNETEKYVGLHNAEGLGKVIYNPEFLLGDENAKCKLKFEVISNEIEGKKTDGIIPTTVLAKYLKNKLDSKNGEIEISKAVQKLVYSDIDNAKYDIKGLKKITSSQWGGIRAYATKTKDFDELIKQLFDKEIGYLTHGVADEKHWGKNKGAKRKAFENICDENKKHGTQFVAKFAAEMAKESRKLNKK